MRAPWSPCGPDQSLRAWPSSPPSAAIPDEKLAELMTLLGGSDTVELKLTVPADQQRAAIRGLGLDPLDAQLRQVVFFDTPDLTLDRAGVVVRARRIQGRAGDSVVKLRPLDPTASIAACGGSTGSASRSTPSPAGSSARGAEGRGRLRRRPQGPAGRARHRASSSPRSSARSSRRTRPRGSSSTISRCSGRSSCSRSSGSRATTPARSSRRCGSIPTAPASSSSRPSACRRRRSRSPPRSACT